MTWFLDEYRDEKHKLDEGRTNVHLYKVHRLLFSLKGKNLFSIVQM